MGKFYDAVSPLKNLFRFMIYVLFNKTYFLKQFLISFWLCWILAARAFLQLWGVGATLQLPGAGLIVVASPVEHELQVHGLQQLWLVGSAVAALGLQSTGSVVVVHQLSCSVACGTIPDQGFEPVSCIGRFSTTEPPGKPQ